MTYHFSKTVNMRFGDVVASTKEALKRHHFRVLTEIDMKDNFISNADEEHDQVFKEGLVSSS